MFTTVLKTYTNFLLYSHNIADLGWKTQRWRGNGLATWIIILAHDLYASGTDGYGKRRYVFSILGENMQKWDGVLYIADHR